jgi:CheY-like chemotaxis protein
MSQVSNTNTLESARREITHLHEELRHAVTQAARAREQSHQKIDEFARAFRGSLTTILGFGDILSAADKSHAAEWNQIAIAGHELMALITSLEQGAAQTEPVDEQFADTDAAPAIHTVLQIEDNETNFRLTERVLEDRPNIEVLWAPNGEKGIDLATTHTPGLILLDLNLPDIHGSDVLVRLQGNPVTHNIPVIVLSADASPTRIEKMLQAGARNYLTKPFDIKRLLCLVDETLQPAA